ncbi:tyrosine--tRNA ligase [Pseudactinotalea sp.]|uniref:tyrosine--tRNA ligase n=1 Tax=Pseudactinotalea sp. TaxID=1926260 RepID=UPI003B3B8C66
MTTPTSVLEHLDRTTHQIFGRDDLVQRLESGAPMRIKFGVDCTAPDLHLGHAVNLWMMRYLQDLGHRVVFLLGDTTSRIGDPTGRSRTRPVLDAEQIDANARAFLAQVGLVLRSDPELLEIRRNSEWYDRMSITDLLSELSLTTHAYLIARDMFQDRIASDDEIGVHELIYPVLQGFDSVALESDLTIVGSDQLFNETVGRHLQAKHGQRPQTVITSTITPGLDGGAKQSKSLDNYVALTHSPGEKLGRLMTLQDDLIELWARVYTDLSSSSVADLGARARVGGPAARDAKLDLAEAVVARYHGAVEARRARAEFIRVFARQGVPADVAAVVLDQEPRTMVELVRELRPDLSGNAARRLVIEGAVSMNGATVTNPSEAVRPVVGDVIRAGRRRWFSVAAPPATHE